MISKSLSSAEHQAGNMKTEDEEEDHEGEEEEEGGWGWEESSWSDEEKDEGAVEAVAIHAGRNVSWKPQTKQVGFVFRGEEHTAKRPPASPLCIFQLIKYRCVGTETSQSPLWFPPPSPIGWNPPASLEAVRRRSHNFSVSSDISGMASAHDRAVLQAIFNPSSPFGDVPGVAPEGDSSDDDTGFDADSLRRVKALEVQGVSAAEAGDLHGALQHFSQAIQTLPRRAAAYNNRAQTLRLQGNTAGALQDLEQAVSLSGGAGRTACQALVQRGLLLRLSGRDDEARADFERAAALGSDFARQQAVALNPYAALCNRMLTEVMSKLRNPRGPETQ